MFGIQFTKPKAEREAEAEKTRVARGELSQKVIELDLTRRHLETLMQTMLAERNQRRNV